MMPAQEKLRILIPLDGSIPGQSSLLAIEPLEGSGPVECTLLHVTESKTPDEAVKAQLELHRRGLEAKGISARIRIVTGKPVEMILKQAAGGEFDLISMSTHGRRGLDRVMMGSIAEEVVRSSPIPALLCRTGTCAHSWERIVVALDGMPGAEEVLEDVIALARRMGSTVHLLQVCLNLLRSNAYRGVAFECPPEEPSSYLEDVAARLTRAGIQVVTERRSGMAAAEIAHCAKEVGAGLVCITTHGRPEEIPGLDRSVTAEVIRQSPCPVYVRRMTGSSCQQS